MLCFLKILCDAVCNDCPKPVNLRQFFFCRTFNLREIISAVGTEQFCITQTDMVDSQRVNQARQVGFLCLLMDSIRLV